MMVDEVTQYVCFIKRRIGAKFIPYTLQEGGIVVKTMREFLNNELARWRASESFQRITFQERAAIGDCCYPCRTALITLMRAVVDLFPLTFNMETPLNRIGKDSIDEADKNSDKIARIG
jgi:hypothetical protein